MSEMDLRTTAETNLRLPHEGIAETDLSRPYKGLEPYQERDFEVFFGRTLDSRVIFTNLIGKRLTILYGPTGVGKSSVLRAGVVHQLHSLISESKERGETPDYAVVHFDAWRDDPFVALKLKIEEALFSSLGGEVQEPLLSSPDDPDAKQPVSFAKRLQNWQERHREQWMGKVLVILDQFEQYFLYHSATSADMFGEEFPRMVNNPLLRVNFLISIREDALAKLDRFKPQILNLLDNTLRLNHLDELAARDAIEKPLEKYNEKHKTNITIETKLVDKVLEQVKTGQVALEAAGRGDNKFEALSGRKQIETPFLQIVMTRLWKEEISRKSEKLRLETFVELGEAERIVRTHLDDTMHDALSKEQRDIAAQIFRYLVTRSGIKVAFSPDDLKEFDEFKNYSQKQIAEVMSLLASGEKRILRVAQSPGVGENAERYEIFHDVLAPAILDWRTRYSLARASAAKSYEDRRFMRGFIPLMAGIALASVIIYVSQNAQLEESELQLTTSDEILKEYKKDQDYTVLLADLASDDDERKTQAIFRVQKLNTEIPSDLRPVFAKLVADSGQQQLAQEILNPLPTPSPSPTDTPPPARVFIQIASAEQVADARRLERRLESNGYVVPGVGNVNRSSPDIERSPPVNELRYFRSEDDNTAKDIVKIFEDSGLGAIRRVRLGGYERSSLIKPGQFELWFASPRSVAPDEGTPAAEGMFIIGLLPSDDKRRRDAFISIVRPLIKDSGGTLRFNGTAFIIGPYTRERADSMNRQLKEIIKQKNYELSSPPIVRNQEEADNYLR